MRYVLLNKLRVGLLVILIVILPAALLAQELIFDQNIQGARFSISLNSTSSYKLDVESKGKIEVQDIFDLENPTRLVVDLKPLGLGKNFNFSLSKDPILSQLRIGSHSDKTRIVLDLLIDKLHKYSWEPKSEQSISIFIELDKKKNDLAKTINTVDPKKVAEEEAAKTQIEMPVKEVEPVKEIENNIVDKIEPAKLPETKVADTTKIETPVQPKKIEPIKNELPVKKESIVEKINKNKPAQAANDQDLEEGKVEEANNNKINTPQALENIKFYFQKEKNTPLVRFMLLNKPEYKLKKEVNNTY